MFPWLALWTVGAMGHRFGSKLPDNQRKEGNNIWKIHFDNKLFRYRRHASCSRRSPAFPGTDAREKCPLGWASERGRHDVLPSILTLTTNTLIWFNSVPHTVFSSLHIQCKFKTNASYNISHHKASARAESGKAGKQWSPEQRSLMVWFDPTLAIPWIPCPSVNSWVSVGSKSLGSR